MNISIVHYISAHFNYLRDLIIILQKYMLVYSNTSLILKIVISFTFMALNQPLGVSYLAARASK